MPGVPPDAVERVKGLLKGMFKRGKNKKQDKPAEATAPAQTPTTDPNKDKPLPTQPLATGQQDTPQEAIPTNHEAQPGPPAGVQDVNKEPGSPGVSPTSPAQPVASEPASAVEKDTTPVTHAANGAADTPTTNTTADKENVIPIAAAQPNGTIEDTKPAEQPVTATAVDPAAVAQPTTEEKQTVHEEPPKVPQAKAAPGMSATSGPLEDFPEGGDEPKA